MTLIITAHPSSAAQRICTLARRFGSLPKSVYAGEAPLLSDVLQALPIQQKEQLLQYGQQASEQYLEDAILFSETSGTTAAPLQTPRGVRDLKWNTLNQVIAYKRHLQPNVDRVAILHPSVLSPFIEASAHALQDLGVGYIRLYPIPAVCDYQRMFDAIKRYKITTIMSTPTLIYKLLYEFKKIDGGRLPPSLKKMLVTGEYFCRDNARNMEKILGDGSCAMPFVYGSSETATLMYGLADGNYKPIAEDFVFEIHPISPQPTAPALGNGARDVRTGRLVVTWLRDGMLPILRYNTGDVFTVWPGQHDGDAIFQFEGRELSDARDMRLKKIVEGALFGIGFPIYHFNCRVNWQSAAMDIDVIAHNVVETDAATISERLRQALQNEFAVSVSVNPAEHAFFKFSPSPKTNKFFFHDN